MMIHQVSGMTIQIHSDLHLEFGQAPPAIDMNSDVLALAGDICSLTDTAPLEALLSLHSGHVIYVAGNHEYYGMSIKEGDDILRGLESRYRNFHWLNNEYISIDDVVFYGGTMWTDLNNGESDAVNAFNYELNDVKYIKGMTSSMCIDMHKDFIHGYSSRADVIITHHAPRLNPKSKYSISNLTHSFCASDVHKKLQCDLWIYGHTHENEDSTHFASNPRGYPWET